MAKPKIRALDAMPAEVKVLYTKLLGLQSIADGQMHSKEFSDLYLFMVQIGLDSTSRDEVKRFLVSNKSVKIFEIALDIVSLVDEHEKEAIRFSIIKDLIRIARVDGHEAAEELSNIHLTASKLYGGDDDQTDKVIALAQETIEYDEKLLKGELSESEIKKGAKDLAAKATAIGVPIAAIYFSGSVVGLSAAGITSGLAAVGLGGVLGFSAMVTGIGVVVILGIATYSASRWVLSRSQAERDKKREFIIQEVIRLHQEAITALAEDLNALASQMENLSSQSEKNREMLLRLRKLYEMAIQSLKEREELYATAK